MGAHTIAGHKIRNQQLRHLRPAVEGWLDIVSRYSKTFPQKDAIYWYNERPNVGALAAGAWARGMIAIEEYSNYKGKGERYTEKPTGRCDLYISDRQNKFDAVIEAKIAWWEEGKGRIKGKMDSACRDALLNQDSDVQIGCVFFVPNWEAKTFHRQRILSIRNMLERFDGEALDLVAWCFPGSSDGLQPERKKWSQYVYPGVVMGMSVAKRSPRKR